MSTVPYIKDSEFDSILTYEGPVVVDFTAPWCGPCRKISPLMEQLAEDYKDRVQVVKIDIDADKATAKKYTIRSIPAVLIFKGGELVENIVGVAPYEKFTAALEQQLQG
ncbi:thioredoxin [Moorena producens JHB]|uniref:Thioredoxin n=1 Tax=Moorena producens (strain JHB) TaxID=1454205 RepID=A0A1D9FT90_MOOP1|nr:thioredoxin [Moorena producens]AOY78591.1 thioredoxin [Moorena producens JHB]